MTTTERHLEREVKLAVWPGFRLPDLDDLPGAAAVSPVQEHRLEATYYDTPDLRLARSNITLRHRSGDARPWTLKLPDSGPRTASLTRTEVSHHGEARAGVPRPLTDLVAARVRTAGLIPVARLDSHRRSTEVLDAEGAVLAEIVDDEVSVLDGRRVALRFREVEVEIAEAAPAGLLDQLVDRLRAAGAAAADQVPKVIRALGPRALDPPELTGGDVDASSSAAAVVAAGLTRSVRQLIEHDPAVREGTDPEAVHQARVATRRLRSDLRAFGDLLDPAWSGSLRDELSWLADALGEVRDLDVLHGRLARQIERLRDDDAAVATSVLEVLLSQRDERRDDLLDAMASRRYVELLDRLVDAAESPRVLDLARVPASELLPVLARRPWVALAKAARAVKPKSPDRELHRVRILAKRARYASDVAALVVGKPARRLADAIADVQEVLGDHQDACVTEDWLRHTATSLPGDAQFVAGQLVHLQRTEAAAQREAFPAAWRAADKEKLRAWLKP